jgi:cystathionine beta-synthase
MERAGPVVDSVLDLVGGTPLVRLTKLTSGLSPAVYAKLELLNPGGSVKDRVGLAMILDAEKKGLVKPGCVIVEPTSGNTGMGLALAAVLKGYKIVFTVPDKMSRDKIDLLRAFGAKVVVTPSNVPPEHPSSYVRVAERIVKETPQAFMPNQYENPSNPDVHYRTTGPEIWAQTDGKVDVLVAGMGTGGTISGTGRFLKEKKPSVKVVGVDPEGSLLSSAFRREKPDVHSYRVEGIGEDFMPSTLDLKVIDEVVTVSDAEAFLTARRLAREEGILAGGSSGAAVFAAVKVAQKLVESQTVVVILPDTGRSYLNKIYNDDWMTEYGFLGDAQNRIPVGELVRSKSKRIKSLVFLSHHDRVSKAIRLMKQYSVSHLPVLSEGVPIGSISEGPLMKKLNSRSVSAHTTIEEAMDGPFPVVRSTDTILDPLNLMKDTSALVVVEGPKAVGIITIIDVVSYLAKQ